MTTDFSYESLKKAIIDETVKSLTEKPIKSTTFEKSKLLYDADLLYSELPASIKYGKSVAYLLEHCSVPVKETDIIVGRVPDWELSEAEEKYFQQYLKSNDGRPAWMRDSGHRSFWWEGLLEYGIPGLKSRALCEIERRKNDGKTAVERLEFLEGAIIIYDAFITYLERYSAAAEKAGLSDAAKTCRALTLHEPRTFREALQLLWIVQLVHCSYIAANPTLAIGRMDLFLERIFENDRASGNLTEDFARLLILDFYSKHNLILGRGEHQMSVTNPESITGWERNLCYDSPQYMILSGRRRDGSYLDGELTRLLVEMIEPRFKNPVAVIRYAPDMQNKCKSLWRTIADKARQSASMMIYNESDVISGYIASGVEPCDAFDFEHYGCNHPTLAGIEALTSYKGYLPLLLFLDILNRWVKDGYEPKSTEELYTAVREAAKEESSKIIDILSSTFVERMKSPVEKLEFSDCFSRYPISAASSFRNYGSKYICANLHICSYASFVDVFCAVNELVIKEKKMTLSHLMTAVNKNYEGYPLELALCRRAPKLGSDNPTANAHAKELMTCFTDDIYELAKEKLSVDKETFIYNDVALMPRPIVRISMESDNGHLDGCSMGATPDGRLSGTPLSQNCAPSQGACTEGLTARLRSVSSIPFDRIVAGAQNLSIQPKLFEGDDGLTRLSAVLGSYFDMGGLQLQVTAVDSELLRKAQADPDTHRDLMVRVTGYSAVFVDMEKHAQDDIIRRDLMGK